MAENFRPKLPHTTLHLSALNLTLALAACLGLQMSSFVIIMPLFARRFADFGAGVEALGISTLAYALTSTLAAPGLGTLADRWGRRPLLLGSLAAYAFVFTGYLLAESAPVFIGLRALAGAFTAGLFPAAMGIVADIAPADRRAQYIGIVNGGASAGWIVGPLLGGFLYDRWGYTIPFLLSVALALLTLAFAFFTIPETNPPKVPRPAVAPEAGPAAAAAPPAGSFGLPRPLGTLAMLLIVSFGVMFAWTFIEPQLMFYVYDELRWTSAQLGWLISAYGIAMVLGEFGLGQLSDRLGRKPVLLLGLALFSAQFAGLVWNRALVWIAAGFILAGLGNALFDPALNALFLDLAPQAHKARLMGLKSTAASLGNMAGPALVVVLTRLLLPQRIFLISLVFVFLLTLLSFVGLRAPAQRPRIAASR